MNKPQTVSGTVEAVHRKTINNGKIKLGICIKDTWYNLLTAREVVGLWKGAGVSFTATNKGGKLGWCVHPGTLILTAAVEQPFDDDLGEGGEYDEDV